MAALAIKSSAVRWMLESGIMFASINYSAASASRSSVSPGFTWVNCTGCSPISIPFAPCRATVKVEVARSPGSGKSDRKWAPREFSRFSAASAMTRLTSHKRAQIEPVVPGQIEAAIGIGDAGGQKFRLDPVERREAARDAGPVAHHADFVPHGIEQRFAQRVQIAGFLRERLLGAREFGIEHVCIRLAMSGIGGDPARHHVAGNAAEHRRIGDAIAAEPIGAVHAAGILAGNEQAETLRRGVDLADDAAHEIMRRRHHFDQAAGQIETAVAAAIDHALELLRHFGRSEMTHLDIDAAVARSASGAHLGIDGAADHVAGGALEFWIVIAHEAVHGAVEQMAAGPA